MLGITPYRGTLAWPFAARWQLATLMLLLMLCSAAHLAAQVVRRPVQEVNDTVPWAKRLSLSTNVIDWALLQANLRVEVDLVGRDYNRWSLVLGARGKWEPANARKSYNVYNFSEYRAEVRHYYRTSYLAQGEEQSFVQRLLSTRRQHPRTNRAYYWGGYASYGTYALKFTDTGRQGQFGSTGVSFGWSTPLYSYLHGYIDIELGASLGLLMTRYDAFTYDEESNCYPYVASRSRGWHLVPYPVPTEVHCSFVLRLNSVKDKYKKINYARRDRLAESQRLKRERKEAADSLKQAAGIQTDAPQARKGLLRRLNPFRKRKSTEAQADTVPVLNVEEPTLQEE